MTALPVALPPASNSHDVPGSSTARRRGPIPGEQGSERLDADFTRTLDRAMRRPQRDRRDVPSRHADGPDALRREHGRRDTERRDDRAAIDRDRSPRSTDRDGDDERGTDRTETAVLPSDPVPTDPVPTDEGPTDVVPAGAGPADPGRTPEATDPSLVAALRDDPTGTDGTGPSGDTVVAATPGTGGTGSDLPPADPTSAGAAGTAHVAASAEAAPTSGSVVDATAAAVSAGTDGEPSGASASVAGTATDGPTATAALRPEPGFHGATSPTDLDDVTGSTLAPLAEHGEPATRAATGAVPAGETPTASPTRADTTAPQAQPGTTGPVHGVAAPAPSGPAPTPSPTAAAAATASADPAPTPRGVELGDLGNRLGATLRGNERAQTLTIHLHPAELGAITVEARLVDGVTNVHLTADSSSTGERLASQMDELRHQLARAGVDLGDLELGQPGDRRAGERRPGDGEAATATHGRTAGADDVDGPAADDDQPTRHRTIDHRGGLVAIDL